MLSRQSGDEVRKLSHIKSDVSPEVNMNLQQHLQQPPPPLSGMMRWFSGEAEKGLKERWRRSRRGRDCFVCVEKIIGAVVLFYLSFYRGGVEGTRYTL